MIATCAYCGYEKEVKLNEFGAWECDECRKDGRHTKVSE